MGTGAREAARAVLKAADAAAAPNPNAARTVPGTVQPGPGTVPPERRAGVRAAEVLQAKRSAAAATAGGVREGSARFGKAVWRPFVKLSGVLWLEMTGVFFGLFAVTAGVGVWKSRGQFQAGGAVEHRVWFAVGMLLVFGYFSVSSFVRARRRGRG